MPRLLLLLPLLLLRFCSRAVKKLLNAFQGLSAAHIIYGTRVYLPHPLRILRLLVFACAALTCAGALNWHQLNEKGPWNLRLSIDIDIDSALPLECPFMFHVCVAYDPGTHLRLCAHCHNLNSIRVGATLAWCWCPEQPLLWVVMITKVLISVHPPFRALIQKQFASSEKL